MVMPLARDGHAIGSVVSEYSSGPVFDPSRILDTFHGCISVCTPLVASRPRDFGVAKSI